MDQNGMQNPHSQTRPLQQAKFRLVDAALELATNFKRIKVKFSTQRAALIKFSWEYL